ncbi:hypothetical protein L1987_04831 [Smallanthus sonchifolius]|uniref:Uncharacterized protein n=1 Tax=Smallanthus sonchifolius TaxID=185202 RepID=A0ACB9JTM5_9ASTR|nr:hypothetical protein L1987_04831 [Smallanthus sonchifolius]
MDGQLKSTTKRAGWSTESTQPEPRSSSTSGVPCGACKFLRRRCVNGCIFAPYFSPEQGTALFAAVHKVFGASNVSKLLMQLHVPYRYHAVKTILYEAQARLSDPVCGCVSIIIALQQQVAELQMELALVQNQVLNTSLMAANTLQGSLQQPEQFNNLELQAGHHLDLQPVYSNGSSVSNNNMISMNMFDYGLHNLANDHQNAVDPQPMFDPLQFTGPFYINEDDDEEETGDPLVFADQMH